MKLRGDTRTAQLFAEESSEIQKSELMKATKEELGASVFDVHPPTPVVTSAVECEQRTEGHQCHLPHSGTSPIPIPTTTRISSRNHTPSSSLSGAHRHHPYSVSSSPSLQPQSRPMSSASWSDLTGSETELDLDFDEYRDDAVPMTVDQRPGSSDIPLLGFAFAGFPVSSSVREQPSRPPMPAEPPLPKPKTSHARKTPPGHIKRPPNAFILFRSHCCAPNASPDTVNAPGTPSAQQLADLGITDHRHISRIASHLWKALSDAERGYWEGKAQAMKEEHQLQHPEYRYRPVYRKKEEIRRRKQNWDGEVENERKACEQVATGLLNEVRVAQGGVVEEKPSFRDVDDIAKTLTGSSTNRRPKRVRSKRPIKTAAQPATPIPEAKVDKSRTEEPNFPPEPHHGDERPHSAPSGDFVVAGTRRLSHFRNVSYNPSDGQGESQFIYMHQLSQALPQPPEENTHFEFPHRPSPAYPDNCDHPPVTMHQSITATGLTASIPHNPTFSYYPIALSSSSPPPSVVTRPLTPRSLAINQLQHYSIQSGCLHPDPHLQQYSEVGISPTSTSFKLDSQIGLTDSVIEENFNPRHPSALRRGSETSNLFLSGMKRRGTLTRTTEGGELMLLSPANSSFPGGRKVSLGRWERDATGDTERDSSHQLSETLTAFEFEESFLHFLPRASLASGGPVDGECRSAYSSSSSAHARLAGFDGRPTSSASDFSADESVADERQTLFHGSDAKYQSHSSQGAFHVGQTDFFLPPNPAQAETPRNFVFGTSPAGQPPPLFTHDIFLSNNANTHRPSIDALLAANSPTYPRYPRGSDATIRMGGIESLQEGQPVETSQLLSPTSETAMAIIDQQLQGRLPEEFETTQYVYLTAELANNAALVELILSHGVGVSYDSDITDASAQSN